jgi:hypothetical protein
MIDLRSDKIDIIQNRIQFVDSGYSAIPLEYVNLLKLSFIYLLFKVRAQHSYLMKKQTQ